MSRKTSLINLKKRQEPFPPGRVHVRFSDWKVAKTGEFQWSTHGFYMFIYSDKGKQKQRQASPGYEPVDIVTETGDEWTVYSTSVEEQGDVY